MITQEVPGALDLQTVLKRSPELLRNWEWLNQVIDQLSLAARRLHEEGFAHNDLKWRNILVTTDQQPTLYLIDCPAGKRWRGPLLEYRKIKDLACLDKVAKYHLSRTQRLRFYLRYAGRDTLNEEDKVLLRRTLSFFEGREKKFLHIDPAWMPLCRDQGLDSFDALWSAELSLVDEPNRARGGWSEVGILTLSHGSGSQQFYVKRQENFNCRTVAHPLRGMPVALREWQTIRALAQKGIATLDVALWGRQCRSDDRGILMTVALADYMPMDEWLLSCAEPEKATSRQQGLLALGRQVGRLHSAGMKHGCLYPKHVYFSVTDPRDLRLIDLEKCKRFVFRHAGLRDLDTLMRHTPVLTGDDRQQIYAGYLETCPHTWTPQTLQDAVAARGRAKKAAR